MSEPDGPPVSTYADGIDAREELDVKPGGQPNLQQLMKQAQKMQRDMAAAQEQLAVAVVTGQAAGGLVTVTMTGAKEVQAVTVDPSVVDPDDVETLQDLLLVAFRDAARAVDELTAETMGPLTSGLGGMGGGLGLPGF
ncbi:MAG: nucleoid-associated protein EbfC [Frankiaceae bacterium]|jgi:DNA-binding YbaB/EbfC family protein|nr:nucleoid-associated protein EbfC [Frankiaceae bacterium]